jgi:hypothetical protein
MSHMVSRKRGAQPGPSTPDIIPDQMAVRYRAGQDQKVCRALAALGTLEEQPSARIVILHRASRVAASKVTVAIEGLRTARLIEFATPVLCDPRSNTRQVLTDEIVLRLKPGGTNRALAALKAEHGVTISKRNEFEPTQYIVKVPNTSGTQTLDVARALHERDDVEFASPNFLTGIKR